MSLSLEVIKYCAEEVKRQGRGAVEVYNMCDAWHYAMGSEWAAPLIDIALLGALVEPSRNGGSFRKVGVMVGDRICPPAEEVFDLMERYIDNLKRMAPAEAYKEFELIHPFVDGNGRVGKIIFNWCNGTLAAPVMPPNFWGIANP